MGGAPRPPVQFGRVPSQDLPLSPRKLGFWSLATRNPGRTVLIDAEGRAWRADELHGLCNRICRGLRRLGLGEGAMVAASMENRAETLALLLAALQAGWYFLPLNPAAPPAELKGVLEGGRPDALVYDQSCQGASVVASTLGPERSFEISTEESLFQDESSEPPEFRRAGSIVALTSGTTGQPRLIRRPLSGLSPEHLGKQAALHLAAVCGIAPDSGLVHLVVSPLHHSASLLWCSDHLHLGHTAVLMRAWDAERALRLIERYRVTGTLLVPTHFRRWLDLPTSARLLPDLSSLRHVVHTGAPCPVSLKREMLEWLGPVITEVYGAAEGPGTRVAADEWLRHPGTVGRGHGRVRVLDEAGRPCAPGEVGEVHLKVGGFASVGDLGYLDEEDYLFLVGRKDDVILSGGVNIHPAEIEEVLSSHPGVADVAVVGLADVDRGQRLHALIVPRGELDLERLEWHCRQRLAPHKCPRRFEIVEALPRDAQGKLRRREFFGSDS